jgi:hypothetical protein
LRMEHEFPLEQAAEAHRALEGRRTTGESVVDSRCAGTNVNFRFPTH